MPGSHQQPLLDSVAGGGGGGNGASSVRDDTAYNPAKAHNAFRRASLAAPNTGRPRGNSRSNMNWGRALNAHYKKRHGRLFLAMSLNMSSARQVAE